MPVTVKFDPTLNSQQAQVIPDASLRNDGVMSKTQVAMLNSIGTEQGVTFEFTGVEPFLEVAWPDLYLTFRLEMAVSAAGGAIVAVNLTKFGDSNAAVDNTGVRVVPAVPFSGFVYVTCKKV